MANWNLSVDLRGHGNDLAQSLKSAAKHARTLGTAAKTAKTQVRELGQASQAATRHIRTLGTAARTTGRHLNTLGNNARTAGRQLGRYGDAARTANRHVNSLGDNSRTTGRQLASVSRQIDTAVRDLLRLAQAAQRASTHMRTVGDGGTRSLRRMTTESGRLRQQMTGVAALMSGGALVMGFGGMLKHGNEYQQSMNTFGAVTGATALQMRRAAATANELGGDLKLPAATAAGAAESMVELAKAGFRTDQAITATRASLTLASAANVSAADSARYLGDMMDQFGMGADQAGKAADTLAATANSASGDIIDIYYAMKYAGPVAHGLGVNMQEAASAVGMLGKAGILGQTAGTTLRGMMANLAAPTKQMTQGLEDMGIQAWDAQGRFKGLRYVIDGLSKAQHRMSQQDFAAAVKKSMGKPAMSGAIALAHQGTDSFDALMQAVSQTGAASDIAAAKGKGLAGAMVQLKAKSEQAGLALYTGMAPGLEFLIRGVTSGISSAIPKIEAFFQYVNDAAALFGPDIAAAARREFGAIGDAAAGMLAPFKELGGDAVASVLHVLLTAGQMVVDVLKNLAAGVEPVVSALGDLVGEGSGAATTLDIVVAALDAAATAVSALSGVLVPIGHVVGGLVSLFASLPGPVQTAVFAMLLFRRVQPMMAQLATTVGGRTVGAFRSLGQQMAVQRSLAASAGQSLTRYGAAMAVLQTRVPAIGAMGAAFRNASAQGTGFAGTLRGVTAAAGSGLQRAMSGLTGALGGPWGLAVMGATVLLGTYMDVQQDAAAAASQHKASVDGLTTALRESNGAITSSVRAQAAQTLADTKLKQQNLGVNTNLMKVLERQGHTLSEVTDAYLGQGSSVKKLATEMDSLAKKELQKGDSEALKRAAEYGLAAKQLRAMSGDASEAAKQAKSLDAATKSGDGVSAYTRLKDAVAALADKTADADSRTRALRDALDLLSGGSVSLQAAQARVNEALTQANDAMASGINRADGWGKALVGVNGALDTTTKNGQQLFSTLNTIADSSSSAAIAAYDFAQSQHKSVPESIQAATREMQRARDEAIKLSKAYGLDSKQAAGVADAMGLIPGQVSILLQTEGVDTTLAELLGVQAEFERFPDKKTVKVEALGADAKKELEEIGYQIELIPGTREYKITAPTAAARAELDLLIAKLGKTNGKTLSITAPTGKVRSELQSIQDKVRATKGKTLSIKAPTDEARQNLEDLGFKIKNTKGKTVTIAVPTGDAVYNARIIQNAIDNIHGKQVGIGVYLSATASDKDANGVPDMIQAQQARGSVLDFYADGGTNRRGIRENHTAQIAPAGAWRVWAEEETGGEAYIPLAASKRRRSRAIAEETIRRLGGDPRSVQWNADGNVTDWTYDPATGSLYSPSDAGQAAHKTKKVKYKAKGKTKTKEVEYFDLAALEKKLKANSKTTATWAKNLTTVADRAGADVADALAAMGEDGIKLTAKMAKGSTKYVNEMSKALRGLAATAKASLTDYTRQLSKANTADAAFAKNLITLSAKGYGDLAKQLAAQGDQAAADLAAAAVKDNKKASSANKAAKTASNALTADQVQQLVAIIAAVKTSKTGLHTVADTTGYGEDEIITIANKATTQIKNALGSRAAQFLADLARANRGLSYADGGIRSGIYATRAGAVTFAEPETGGEAYIPLGPSKRSAATRVLHDVAGRFGLGLTDMSATRPVVVVRESGDTNVNVTAVRTGASATDIASQVGRSVRRARRGGVNARAAA
ncbi:phage tail tape measure protein [Streptomyces sp. NPDC032161]|uniref:phage tail tape measure protein n=1 Tax=unclassified Streptomyces TaxID=2593676 RepID=UPI003403A310